MKIFSLAFILSLTLFVSCKSVDKEEEPANTTTQKNDTYTNSS